MNLVDKIESYLSEAPNDHIVPGVAKTYFSKNETISKNIDFVDEGSKMWAKVWLGKLGKKDVYAVAFHSSDLGVEAKIKSFKSQSEAKEAFDKIKNNISYDDILKLLR